MDKVLKIYKIPEQELIVGVIAVLNSSSEGLPAPETAGSLAIWDDGVYGYRLWKVENVYGELDWIDIPFDSSVYYMDLSADEPKIYFYDQGGDTILEYASLFPSVSSYAQLVSFSYGATRMGNAPTISGTVMHRQCLDDIWTDRVCVYFNKMFYFIDKIPTSEYSNADERYKHSVEFVSERVLLEHVFFANVVDAMPVQEDIVAPWYDFSFFGDIQQLADRLNASLEYSGLGLGGVGFNVVVDNDEDTAAFINSVEEKEKLITVSETTLKAALDMIYDEWGLPYWFDGYTIHLGLSNNAQMQAAGVTMPIFRYGATNHLLSIQKNQTNEIVNRITGVGGGENLPTYYPNKTPKGLELQYMRSQTMMVDYARIANPNRLVNITATDEVFVDTPHGTFFKFMPITNTYTYDQFITINPHHKKTIGVDENGDPQLVDAAVENYNLRSRFFDQPYGGTAAIIGHQNAHPDYNISCKRIWVWLQEGTLVNISLKDEMNAPDMFDKGGAPGIFFEETHMPRFFIKAQSYSYTRELFELVSKSTQGFSPYSSANLIDKYFNLRTVGDNVVYVWDDGTETSTYNEVFPIEMQPLPANTTCLSFTVGIMSTYNSSIADPDYVKIQLKTNTQTVLTHTFLSDPDWSKNADGKAVNLYRACGVRINSGVTPQNGDIIYFTQAADYIPLKYGSLMPSIFRDTGDVWIDARNNEYLKENSQIEYYKFENEYKVTAAKEAIVNFEDIKPTIKGMTNNQSPAIPIDRFREVAFDQDDNNELAADGSTYLHPYFYVKLARTSLDDGYGFNLFDCAMPGNTMQIKMTSGNCGGCSFDVMVKYNSDGSARNPVGVFEEATEINGVTYPAGSPKRDANGNVLVNQYQEVQQYTNENEVWIALKKDNETFSGTKADVENGNITLPDSSSENRMPTANLDTFVILNINLPYAYVVAAEKRLYYALLDELERQNIAKFGFNIKFSSLYYKKQYQLMDKWLNESSLVPFVYNNHQRRYYVQSYSYKVTDGKLPEVTIELQEKLREVSSYFYPIVPGVPDTPPVLFTTDTIKKMMIQILNSGASLGDMTLENVHINGDVTLSDNTSLNAQIASINNNIFTNETIQTREYEWGKVGKRAEVENLFVDGIFATDLNTTTADNVRITHNQDGAVGENSLHAFFAENGSSFSFDQKVPVERFKNHTAAFFAKTSAQDDVVVYVTFYDEYDNKVDSVKKPVSVGFSWEQHVVPFYTTDGAEYAVLSFSYFGDSSNVEVDFDGIAVYPDDYTAKDQYGEDVASSLLPVQYKMGSKDIFNAIKKLGGGNIETDSWQTIVAEDGDTGTTIVPTTRYTVVFINNSANGSDYTVSFDTTGIETIYKEYESLVVRASDTVRFDVKKFVHSNNVCLSVKRTDVTTTSILRAQ